MPDASPHYYYAGEPRWLPGAKAAQVADRVHERVDGIIVEYCCCRYKPETGLLEEDLGKMHFNGDIYGGLPRQCADAVIAYVMELLEE